MILLDVLVRECGCRITTVYLITDVGVFIWVREDTLDCWFIRQ